MSENKRSYLKDITHLLILLGIMWLGLLLGSPFRSHGDFAWVLAGLAGIILSGIGIYLLYLIWASNHPIHKWQLVFDKMVLSLSIVILICAAFVIALVLYNDAANAEIISVYLFYSGILVIGMLFLIRKWIYWLNK